MAERTLPDHVLCDVIPAIQGTFSTIDAVLVSSTLLITGRQIPEPVSEARLRFKDHNVVGFNAKNISRRIGGSDQNLITLYSVQLT